MKLRKRGFPRLSSYLIASTLSTAGFSLVSMAVSAGTTPAHVEPGQTNPVSPSALPDIKSLSEAQQAPVTPPETKVPVISDIEVIGNKTLNKAFIILISGAHIGDPCTERLQASIADNLYRTGDFGSFSGASAEEAVKVHSEEPSPPNGTCKVVIEVDENPTIQNISLTGAGPIKPEEVLPLLQGLKKGTVYSVVKFNQDLNDIYDLYRKRGYTVTVGQDVSIDNAGVLTIPLIVTRVSEIKIIGLHKTRRYVVTRELLTKVGDYFNTNALVQDRVRLINLDLFEDVNPSYNETGPGQETVTINVVEKRSGTVTAGVGYSDRAQLIGFGEIVETNFRGTGESINLRGEIGGVAGRASVELGFNEPYLDRKHTALNVQLYDKTIYRFSDSLTSSVGTGTTYTSDNRYNEQRLGTTITVSRPVRRDLRASVSVRAEQVDTDPLNLPLNDLQIIQDGPIYVLGGSLLHDSRDLDLDPASGGFQQLSLEGGHADLHAPSAVANLNIPGVYGSVNFLKPFLELRQYFSLSGRRPRSNPTKDETVLALRGELGASTGTLPFFEQFFVGGGDNLRGYRDDRFWGKYLFLASAEFRQPLAPKFKGVLFVDVGDAWGGSYSNVIINGFAQSGFHPHIGVGLGIRVVTPIGPLRLDYGIGDEGGRTHFSIGPTF